MFDMQWEVVYVWRLIPHAHDMLILLSWEVLYGVKYSYQLPIRKI